jgi:hypothetical protein
MKIHHSKKEAFVNARIPDIRLGIIRQLSLTRLVGIPKYLSRMINVDIPFEIWTRVRPRVEVLLYFRLNAILSWWSLKFLFKFTIRLCSGLDISVETVEAIGEKNSVSIQCGM